MFKLNFDVPEQTDCTTGVKTEVKLHWIYDPDKRIIKILNGSTGHESWYLDDIKSFLYSSHDFPACSDTKNHWDTLHINGNDFRAVLALLLDMK